MTVALTDVQKYSSLLLKTSIVNFLHTTVCRLGFNTSILPGFVIQHLFQKNNNKNPDILI